MRRIGTLSDGSLARRFCDYLVTLSIDSSTDVDGDGEEAAWSIWIREETDVARAREEFLAFEASPSGARYQVEDQATRIRDERISEEQRRRKQQKQVQSMPPSGRGIGALSGMSVRQQGIPVTIAIIALSVMASFSTNFGDPHSRAGTNKSLEEKLYDGMSFVDRDEYRKTGDAFVSVKQGQLWRFLTPMFMHGDAMHLAFNMLWVFFLGSAIERLQGSWFFAALALGTHVVGISLHGMMSGMDFLPATLQGVPFAIGASGAVYGLFGYLWIRPTIDPDFPIRLVPMNVALMLGWLVLCMTPVMSNVANGAHLGGLAAGIGVALISRPRPGG